MRDLSMRVMAAFYGLGVSTLLSACAAPEAGVMVFPSGEVQRVVRADSIPWQPCPPSAPSGCEMAILEGDPKGDDLYAMRLRTSEDMVLPVHWHPREERVTVISGSVAVDFGEDAARADAIVFGPGDYYVTKRHAVHGVWVDAGTVLQITGIGPWETVPLAQTLPPP